MPPFTHEMYGRYIVKFLQETLSIELNLSCEWPHDSTQFLNFKQSLNSLQCVINTFVAQRNSVEFLTGPKCDYIYISVLIPLNSVWNFNLKSYLTWTRRTSPISEWMEAYPSPKYGWRGVQRVNSFFSMSFTVM